MTSFDLAALVPELNRSVKGARMENIYQLNSKTLLFRLHQPNQPVLQLLVEAGKRANLTSYVLSKPSTPPAFCMALRKHLRNGRIREIQQPDFERAVVLLIDTHEGMFSLITELFGDGNIILLDSHSTILYALSYRSMRDRNILRGEKYQPAPSSGKDPFKLNREDFNGLMQFGQLEIVRALTKFLGIGGLYAEEILLRANIDKNAISEALTPSEIEAIHTEIKQMTAQIADGKICPNIVADEKGEFIDVVPFPLRKYSGLVQKSFDSFNEALDEYYSKAVIEEKTEKAGTQFERELARLQRTLEDQERTLEDSKRITEQNKRLGDLIYGHFSELQFLIQFASEARETDKSWEQIALEMEKENKAQNPQFTHFQSLDAKGRILNVKVDDNPFSLDLTKSIPENAAEYYERAKKAGRKLEGARKAIADTRKKIDESKKRVEIETEIAKSEVPEKRREKAWFEKFRWFLSSDGSLVVGGRDATTNEILIKKYTEPTDVVFHAEVAGAPFVVIKTEGKTPSEQTIFEAAQFAASYSKAWREILHAVDVYWVHPAQLSKTPPPGQFIEKGAFIVQGKKNYLRSLPLRIAIGLAMQDNIASIVGGPSSAVKKQTDIFIELVPGKEKSNILAKAVRKMLAEKSYRMRHVSMPEIALQEIQSYIPYGQGEIAI